MPRFHYPGFSGEFTKTSENHNKENSSLQTGRCFPREEFPNFYCESRHSNFLPQDLGLVASWKYVARRILTLVQGIEIFGLKIDFQLFKKTEAVQSEVR